MSFWDEKQSRAHKKDTVVQSDTMCFAATTGGESAKIGG